MSAEIPCAASECIMPTWMAPKLPPPANTKAVLAALGAGATESDTDKPRPLPHSARWRKATRRLGRFIAAEGYAAILPMIVIPGRAEREPGIHSLRMDSGSAPEEGASRNDG